MAVQGTLVLNTKNYLPRGRVNDIASWVLAGDTSFGGANSTVQESVRGPSKEGVNRVRFTLQIPKAATADSVCACAGSILGTGSADISIIVPSAFTAAERQDFVDRIQSLVATAVFDTAVANLEPAW